MLDYDREAARYDETRGGEPRAVAAASAILTLVPPHATVLVDVACGTGFVTTHLRRSGCTVLGIDRAAGMARLAATRLGPDRVVLGDGTALPIADQAIDVLSTIWLLHLVDDVAGVIAEAARVLRPGGVLITTVDKEAAHDVGSDIDALLRPFRSAAASDSPDEIYAYGQAHGLVAAGRTSFIGHDQGRTPRSAAENVRRGYYTSVARFQPDDIEQLAQALDRLPDPDRRRPEPTFPVIALQRRA